METRLQEACRCCEPPPLCPKCGKHPPRMMDQDLLLGLYNLVADLAFRVTGELPQVQFGENGGFMTPRLKFVQWGALKSAPGASLLQRLDEIQLQVCNGYAPRRTPERWGRDLQT